MCLLVFFLVYLFDFFFLAETDLSGLLVGSNLVPTFYTMGKREKSSGDFHFCFCFFFLSRMIWNKVTFCKSTELVLIPFPP